MHAVRVEAATPSSCKKSETSVRSDRGAKEKALKEAWSLTITSCCKTTMVMVSGLLRVGGKGGMGFAGWHGEVKTLGYKRDKDGNKLKEAQFF